MTLTSRGLISTAAALFLHHPNRTPVTVTAWHAQSLGSRDITHCSTGRGFLYGYGCKSCQVRRTSRKGHRYFMTSTSSSSSSNESSPKEAIHMIQFDTVNSTQDEARRILQGKDKDFSVSTTNGKYSK